MRGYSTVLLDRADLGQGTTARFHGLLHSGGRYVVSDPLSATECADENAILTRIQSSAIERTGGYFVTAPGDDPAFADKFLADGWILYLYHPQYLIAHTVRLEGFKPMPDGLLRVVGVKLK